MHRGAGLDPFRQDDQYRKDDNPDKVDRIGYHSGKFSPKHFSGVE